MNKLLQQESTINMVIIKSLNWNHNVCCRNPFLIKTSRRMANELRKSMVRAIWWSKTMSFINILICRKSVPIITKPLSMGKFLKSPKMVNNRKNHLRICRISKMYSGFKIIKTSMSSVLMASRIRMSRIKPSLKRPIWLVGRSLKVRFRRKIL